MFYFHCMETNKILIKKVATLSKNWNEKGLEQFFWVFYSVWQFQSVSVGYLSAHRDHD